MQHLDNTNQPSVRLIKQHLDTNRCLRHSDQVVSSSIYSIDSFEVFFILSYNVSSIQISILRGQKSSKIRYLFHYYSSSLSKKATTAYSSSACQLSPPVSKTVSMQGSMEHSACPLNHLGPNKVAHHAHGTEHSEQEPLIMLTTLSKVSTELY